MNNKSRERIAVVVLNYKAANDTVACVESLMNQSLSDFIIVIVENGSNDNSAKVLKKVKNKYPSKINLLFNEKNLGFAGGVNTGIEWARSEQYDYIALFNNDARADPLWLESLVTTARGNKKIGIVTSLLLHKDGKTIDSTGEQYSIWGLPFPRNRNDKTTLAPSQGFVFGATGGASLYRTTLFNDIGIFDANYFAYFEDVDISFRAQLAGWKIYYQPKAIAYHQQGGTSSKMPGFTIYQAFKNWPLVYIKNTPLTLLFSVGIRFYFAYWLMLFHAVTKGDGKYALRGMVESLWYGIKSFPKRWGIQKNRRVTVHYIRSILWHDLPPHQDGLRKIRKYLTGK